MKKVNPVLRFDREMKARKAREVIVYIFYAIILVVCIFALVRIYKSVMLHDCPYCGARIEYVDKIYRHHTTKFRYQCVENPLHYVDLDVKIY